MEGLIKQAFLHVDTVGPHVMEGHYDLIGPDNEIILPQVWEVVVKPGWEVMMELWPLPDPDLIAVPSAYPTPPLKQRGGKVPDRKNRPKPRLVDPSPAGMEAMPPPPPNPKHTRMPPAPMAGGPVEIVTVIDEASSKSSKTPSTKRKDARVGPFTTWMMGGGLKRSSGKGDEKPGVSQHYHVVQSRSKSPPVESRALVKHDPTAVQQRIKAAYVVRHSEVPQVGCTVS